MSRLHRLTAAAALLGGLAAASVAAAQDAPAAGPTDGPMMEGPMMEGPMMEGPMMGGHMMMMGGPMRHGRGIDFAAIDTDGDGTLTRAELVARATERLAEADANTDGMLDRDEIILALPGPRSAFLHIFSADPAEAWADRLLAMMGATESGQVEVAALAERRVNDLFAWIDVDRDAAVSLAEVEALQERHAERMEHYRDMRRYHDEGRGRDRD
jgi:hypothetical protein